MESDPLQCAQGFEPYKIQCLIGKHKCLIIIRVACGQCGVCEINLKLRESEDKNPTYATAS